MSYAVVRMQKMKSHDLKGIQFHNQRERESKTNEDIDEERSKENYDLVNEENINYNERVKEIINEQKVSTRKTRKDAVLVNELLVTSDKKFFERLDPEEQKQFFEESYKLFSERYGKQNIAYATVHVDEKTPHLHIGVVPMRDGRLQGKNVFNRQELLWLQEKFPEHMQKLGFDLERGEKGSSREHVETAKFKKQTLEKDIDLLEKNLSEKKNELSALNEKIPDEIEVSAKRQMKNIEVPTGEINIFGKSKTKTQKEPTGNVVVPEDNFKKLISAAKNNKQLKGQMKKILSTDIAKENQKLKEELQHEKKHYEVLSTEYNRIKERKSKSDKEKFKLSMENDILKDQISDLKRDIGLIYESTREFLKERTDGLKAFKNVFKDFVDKVKNKTMDFQEKRNMPLERNEFEKIHSKELRKERDRGMER